jgi:hypothetical protein
MAQTPAMKRTSSKKSATPLSDATTSVNNITASTKKLKVNKMFSMNFQFPFFMTTCLDGLDERIYMELLIPTVPKEFFALEVEDNGSVLSVSCEVPRMFTEETRIFKSQKGNDGFNSNTHLVQAYRETMEDIDAHHGFTNHLFGDPMLIHLPFRCEDRITHWRIDPYKNKLANLSEELSRQYLCTLSITLTKLKSKVVRKADLSAKKKKRLPKHLDSGNG